MSIECDVVATHRAGDHDVLFGTLLFVRAEPGEPLLYYRGRYAHAVAR
jgi:flavin reductase (DIM6/NTAB) family NADH-FMN oxidoreductase RutF